MLDRFNRDYSLDITFPNGDIVTVLPPLNIDFDVTKSTQGALNTGTLRLYNLGEELRNRLVRDKEDFKTKYTCELKAGYSKIETIFKAEVHEAHSNRQGANIVTTVVLQDGLFDMQNSFTSKTVRGNIIKEVLKDMPNTFEGKITNQNPMLRPRVLVGNSLKLIEENLGENETYYIDRGVLNIIKNDEVISSYAPLVNAQTGLIDTPKKNMNEVSFKTLLNPQLQIGGLCELESLLDKRLNGVYKIVTIKYTGSYEGSTWEQDITCFFDSTYKVL